jgi:hypothetical protein
MLHLLLPYVWIKKPYFLTGFDSEMIQKFVQFLIKQEIKCNFYKGTEFLFFSSAEYFGNSGRISFERVGNTDHSQRRISIRRAFKLFHTVWKRENVKTVILNIQYAFDRDCRWFLLYKQMTTRAYWSYWPLGEKPGRQTHSPLSHLALFVQSKFVLHSVRTSVASQLMLALPLKPE